MLTAAQIAARKGKLTASRVAVLMNGDADGIRRLWLEMIGEPDYQQEDLSAVWAVQLGSVTEQLNLDWYERKHAPVSRRGEVVTMAHHNWAACTLDGWDEVRDCPIECKHVGGFEHLDKVVGRYQPQMQWQMLVTQALECALSVIVGAQEPVIEIIPADIEYRSEMMERAKYFMSCVESLTDPVPHLPPTPPPVIPVKTYNMAGNNEWAVHADRWLENRQASKIFETAKDGLKKLVPADAVLCHGYDVEVKRARDGSLRIREAK